jgi:aubergine-like protein
MFKDTMVIGIDTYHDTLNSGESVVAVCATTNSDFTRIFTQTFNQPTGRELGEDLHTAMYRAVVNYHNINKKFPDSILIYRDGVGDAMLPAVYKVEIEKIEKAFESLCEDYREFKTPSCSFTVVKKRNNMRLFAIDKQGNICNPSAGTVVDNTVTKSLFYDYYIVCHEVCHGTVSLIHCNIIFDTTSLTPDDQHIFTYYLAHLYPNWAGNISVPSVLQHAHKAAYLVGQSVHRPVHESCWNDPYFL